ncbi:MAG: tyrosine-type recombinase/integrase [Sphaerochaeta sp.]
MAGAAPFTLCRIFHGERAYYYALFRDPKTGKRTNKKSVEMIRKQLGEYETSPIKRRDEAIRICYKALETGIIFSKKKEQSLISYLESFYTWDTSEYVKRRNMLEPGAISPDYLATRLNLLINHVLPLIQTNLLLSEVTLSDLERMQMELVEKSTLSKSTINMAMTAVLVALREARRKGLLPPTTILQLKHLASEHRERGILSEQELTAFMQYAKAKSEKRIYLACLLALLTGMRSGELRGLQNDEIGMDRITISVSYADRAGLKPPKGKRTRLVPCPSFLCSELKTLADENPFPSPYALVFWSKKQGTFVSSHYFSQRFQQELVRSGVLDEDAVKKRNITFHSLRHMANTLLRGTVDDHVLRMTIGHSSEQLSNLYTHLSQRGMQSVQLAQQNLILPLLEQDTSVLAETEEEPTAGFQ